MPRQDIPAPIPKEPSERSVSGVQRISDRKTDRKKKFLAEHPRYPQGDPNASDEQASCFVEEPPLPPLGEDLQKVARTTNMFPEDVLRQADILPTFEEKKKFLEEWRERFGRETPIQRKHREDKDVLEFLIDREQKFGDEMLTGVIRQPSIQDSLSHTAKIEKIRQGIRRSLPQKPTPPIPVEIVKASQKQHLIYKLRKIYARWKKADAEKRRRLGRDVK